MNPDCVNASSEIAEVIERYVSDYHGHPARHLRDVIINHSTPFKTSPTHTYSRHWLDVGGREIVVFVKRSESRVFTPLDVALSRVRGCGFRTPLFYGGGTLDAQNFGIWENVQSAPLPFWKLSYNHLERLVSAIAAYGSLPGTHPELLGDLPVRMRWVGRPMKWYLQAFSDCESEPGMKALAARTHDILLRRDEVVRRLTSAGVHLLTHWDIHPKNISVDEAGDDVIIWDWTGASLSVPGVDIAFIGTIGDIEARQTLIEHYVARLRDAGLELTEQRVYWTARLFRGFLRLQRGWTRRDADAIESALRLITSQYANQPLFD